MLFSFLVLFVTCLDFNDNSISRFYRLRTFSTASSGIAVNCHFQNCTFVLMAEHFNWESFCDVVISSRYKERGCCWKFFFFFWHFVFLFFKEEEAKKETERWEREERERQVSSVDNSVCLRRSRRATTTAVLAQWLWIMSLYKGT